MRGQLNTVPVDFGYGKYIHEAYNDDLMISTVFLPPGILASIDQVPLYPNYLPKRLDSPGVAFAYGKSSGILHPDYPAVEPMFGCNSIQFGMRFRIPFHCRDGSLRGIFIPALEILIYYSITPTLIQDHNLRSGMDKIIDMLLPGCLPYNLAG